MRLLPLGASVPLWFTLSTFAAAPTNDAGQAYLKFVQAQGAALRAGEHAPATLPEWERERTALRKNFEIAWGGFPATPCPLEPRKLGELQREGYRVEKILFQTRPGVWMTANTYVPDRAGKLPAVLCVHGHWKGAKQDPVVQSRCIGLAKLGFFVLVVDAFGAGERAVGKALGEYHGEMTAGTLWPVGLPLSGLQVYENTRAVDYLLTRPEVDPQRLGITGASGGGNQTMYGGAWEERFSASVPVCSVGSYTAYLGSACCMCEVVPGALRFAGEWGVLALTAPRGLMVINATKDSFNFSIGEAKKSLALAQPVFDLYGKHDHLKHATFESVHAYNQPMREEMYGWMTRHLKQSGNGAPIPEPEIKTEEPEALRCFPGTTRPDDFVTIPKFAAAEARKLLQQRHPPANAANWKTEANQRVAALTKFLGGIPAASPLKLASAVDPKGNTLTFETEPGLTISALHRKATKSSAPLAVVLDLDGAEQSVGSDLADVLRRDGWSVAFPELRATGRFAYSRDKVGRAPDHNTAEWALWIGRPLLGQWTVDVRRTLDALSEREGRLPDRVAVIGVGPAGVVAVCAAALDARITDVATLGTLASYVTEVPYEEQRLGILAPGILRDAGDIAHLAALIAPRRFVVAGGVNGAGQPLNTGSLREQFSFTRKVYDVTDAADNFAIVPEAEPTEMLRRLK